MDITAAISSQRAQAITADRLPGAAAKLTPEEAKLHESCKHFEAIIWRSVLETASSPMLGDEKEGADKTGTYQYFVNNSMANAVSGLPSSFSSILYSQLSSHLKIGTTQNNPL